MEKQLSIESEESPSMAEIDAVSVLPKSAPTDDKLVFVRVKRKAFQSRLDAFWLEINERPAKRPLLDFDKLCISDSSSSAAVAKEEVKTKKVLVQHVETISSSESTIDIVQSFVPHSADVLASKTKMDERRSTFKKENKQDQLLSKARQKQEVLAKNARFEQLWRSRKGNEEALLDKSLHEMCRFYDIVRVDVEENSNEMQQEDMSLEDQRLLCSYLPLLRDLIPNAAAEIESDMNSFISKQASEDEDEYVYDVYTVKKDTDMSDEESSNPFPLVQVDEEDFYDGPDDSDYESDDSNAENNPQNDYPDEKSEEEDQVEEKSSDEESEADESSTKSSDSDDIADGVEDAIYEDEMDADEYDQDFDFSDVQEWR